MLALQDSVHLSPPPGSKFSLITPLPPPMPPRLIYMPFLCVSTAVSFPSMGPIPSVFTAGRVYGLFISSTCRATGSILVSLNIGTERDLEYSLISHLHFTEGKNEPRKILWLFRRPLS